ncbi:HNH endonuclease [Clavibacter capsici]|uniref:HNH endonuclease n=1 Tax=Clavibacter capsici TaxID=1874630 RepID=UPI00293ED7F2|nr:hypothetical protein [Clavibacter capsici]
MTTTRPVLYNQSTHENQIIRAVLAKHCNYRCYICGEPRLFEELVVDHLLAETTSPEALTAAISSSNLPADFKLNGPENLAIACQPCNQSKGAANLKGVLRFDLQLQKSVQQAAAIIRRVQAMRAGHNAAAVLANASQVPTASDSQRAAFTTFAPAIVQKLGRLDENLVDFSSSQDIYHPDFGENANATMILRNDSRFVRDVTAFLCNTPLASYVTPAVTMLIDSITTAATEEIPRHSTSLYGDYVTVGPTTVHNFDVKIENFNMQVLNGTIEYKISGDVDAWISADTATDDPFESGELRSIQTGVLIIGPFSASWAVSGLPKEQYAPLGQDYEINVEELSFEME